MVVKAKSETRMARLSDLVETDKPLINRKFALCNLLCVVDCVILSVVEVFTATGLRLEVGRLIKDHLAHFIDKEALMAFQSTKSGHGLDSLSSDELLEIHFFLDADLRFAEQLLVLSDLWSATEAPRLEAEVEWHDDLHLLVCLLDVRQDGSISLERLMELA